MSVAGAHVASGARRYPWLLVAAIGLATFLVFSNSLDGRFILDDLSEIVANSSIRRIAPPVEAMTRGRSLPAWSLPSLTFAADHALWGMDPKGYHVTNLAIHLCAAFALFDLVLVTLASLRGSRFMAGHATPLAATIALVWAVHPLHTQSVTYVYQRGGSLSGMLCLVSLAAYARAAFGVRSIPWLAASIVAAVFAMLSSETSVVLPLVILAYDWCFVAQDARDFRMHWRRHATLATTWLVFALQVLVQRANASGAPSASHGALEYLRTQPGIAIHYLGVAFAPGGQQLAYDWPIAREPMQWLPQTLAMLGVMSVVAVGIWRRLPWSWLGLVFLLTLAPTSSFVPLRDMVADQRMYLPLAALVAMVVLAIVALMARFEPHGKDADRPVWTWLVSAVGVIVVGWLGAATFTRNSLFHDETDLWMNLLEHDPTNSKANAALSQILARNDDPATALEYARRATDTDPASNALIALATTFLLKGDDKRADTTIREAIERYEHGLPTGGPAVLRARQTRAAMLFDQNRLEQAAAVCSRQIADLDRICGPDDGATIQARTILAHAALKRGHPEEAEGVSRDNLARAIDRFGPGEPVTQEAAVPLVLVLHDTGRTEEANHLLRRLIADAEAVAWRRSPDLRVAWRTLAGLLETTGRYQQAADLRTAVLTDCVNRLGDEHPQTIRAAVLLDTTVAAAARAGDDLAAAEKTARHGLSLAITWLGVADLVSQAAAVTLSEVLAESGRPDDSEKLLRQFLDEVALAARAPGSRTIDATIVQKALATLLEKAGRDEDAVRIRRLIGRFLLKLRGPDDPATQEAGKALEATLSRLPKPSEPAGPPDPFSKNPPAEEAH